MIKSAYDYIIRIRVFADLNGNHSAAKMRVRRTPPQGARLAPNGMLNA
jgi:hypothetical protein